MIEKNLTMQLTKAKSEFKINRNARTTSKSSKRGFIALEEGAYDYEEV